MRTNLYHVISATSEDRFGETDDLAEALRIARTVARESPPGDSVLVEYQGQVIMQFSLQPDGRVAEEPI